MASQSNEEKQTKDSAFTELMQRRADLRNAKRALQVAADARKRYDYEWMVRDMFRRGYHFNRYQPQTQTVVLASRQSARVPINIVAAQMRAIRNQVTSFRPKFEVLPRYTNEQSHVQARYSQRLLDYYFDKLKLKTKIKETVTQGLMYSVGGPWEIIYNDDKKEIEIWLLDPFDFYIDPYAESLEDAEFVIKAVRRPLAEIQNDPDFDEKAKREVTSAEQRLAQSEYKQFMIQALRIISPSVNDVRENIILYQGHFKRHQSDGSVKILKMVWTMQNETPLIYEETDEDEYDYVLYRADLNPKDVYGEGWMKQVIPVNRVIDALESSTYEYNYRVAKGRLLVDKDSGVRSIHNIHGEIVEVKPGARVQAMDMPALPIAVPQQIQRMQMYIEDIGAVHEASLGRMPTGIRSGVGIAELKQSDSTGQDDLVDNLEDFLEAVGIKVLKKISENFDSYHVIRDLGYKDQEEKYFAVVGEDSGKRGSKFKENQIKIGPDWLDLAVIGDDNQIRVTIGSWLGYTKEAMQQKVLQLAQAKLIDQKTFLQLWEFGDIDDIVQRTRIEALLQKNLNAGLQQQNGEEDQYGLAMTENEMMVNEDKDMPVDPHDDHVVHIAVHQEALGKGADELVGKHISLHQMYLEQGPQAPNPQENQNDQQRNQQVQQQNPQQQLPMGSMGPVPQQPMGQPQGGGMAGPGAQQGQ